MSFLRRWFIWFILRQIQSSHHKRINQIEKYPKLFYRVITLYDRRSMGLLERSEFSSSVIFQKRSSLLFTNNNRSGIIKVTTTNPQRSPKCLKLLSSPLSPLATPTLWSTSRPSRREIGSPSLLSFVACVSVQER